MSGAENDARPISLALDHHCEHPGHGIIAETTGMEEASPPRLHRLRYSPLRSNHTLHFFVIQQLPFGSRISCGGQFFSGVKLKKTTGNYCHLLAVILSMLQDMLILKGLSFG